MLRKNEQLEKKKTANECKAAVGGTKRPRASRSQLALKQRHVSGFSGLWNVSHFNVCMVYLNNICIYVYIIPSISPDLL
jgi:hypothetical protein